MSAVADLEGSRVFRRAVNAVGVTAAQRSYNCARRLGMHAKNNDSGEHAWASVVVI